MPKLASRSRPTRRAIMSPASPRLHASVTRPAHPGAGSFVYGLLTRRLDATWTARLDSRNHSCGGVAERLKAAVLKTAGPQGLAGSNPASSANNFARFDDRGCAPVGHRQRGL